MRRREGSSTEKTNINIEAIAKQIMPMPAHGAENSNAQPQHTDSAWLCNVLHKVEADIDKWPDWLRKAAGVCVRSPRSDQPPAKATDDKQEWWVEQTADGDWSLGSGNRGFALFDEQSVALDVRDRHNAELIAALPVKGALDLARNRILQFEAALAAERQRREQAEHWLGELLAVIHCDGGHYQSEHGTEKATKDAIDKRNRLVARNDILEYQLLSALAAIEKHNKAFKNWSDDAVAPIQVDLSALRKHDEKLTAEVREPLVDALEGIRNHADGYNRSHCLGCSFSFNTATSALAKVKL